ncbi:MAG: S1C family serine protease [Candidatus Pacearchaeota archaeon]|jgi:hypothetical protein
MDRRHFLVTGLAAGLIGCKNYLSNLLNEIDLDEGKLLLSLKKYVIKSETKVDYFMDNYDRNLTQYGMGIVYKDFYFTLGHIVDFSKGVPVNTPFGLINRVPEKLKFETKINGVKLEKLIFDENDVAIFKLPKNLDVPRFPLEPRKDIYLGERIADIGNPQLLGFNYRMGKISDLDGIKIPGGEGYENSIGTDIGVIPGDSGTPVISMSDKKLVGIMGLRFWGAGYFQPIKNFLKYL